MSLRVKPFEFNMFGEITYVVWDSVSHQGAVIDPSMVSWVEENQIDTFIADNGITVKYLVNTHLHIDHCFGVNHMRTRYGVGISASSADEFLAARIAQQAQMFHLPIQPDNVAIEHRLSDGDTLKLGNETIQVIAVPGHSPGGIALYAPESGFVITGDSLFQRSIGRTDLPGGDHSTLIRSVTDRLLTLPGETKVYPGHGSATTIEDERRFNPYL